MPNPTTQAEVDAALAAMFAAFDTKMSAAATVAAAQQTLATASIAWQTALTTFSSLLPGTPQAQIDAAKQALVDAQASRLSTNADYKAAQATAAGAPAAFDTAKAAYTAALTNLINGT